MGGVMLISHDVYFKLMTQPIRMYDQFENFAAQIYKIFDWCEKIYLWWSTTEEEYGDKNCIVTWMFESYLDRYKGQCDQCKNILKLEKARGLSHGLRWFDNIKCQAENSIIIVCCVCLIFVDSILGITTLRV